MVLLHGLGGSPSVWGRVAPLLAGYGVATVTPRLRGGLSIEEEADHIAKMLPELGSPVVLVGHSMGGLVATAIAERHRRQVGRLVLINTPPTAESRISAHGAAERIPAVPVIGPLLWNLLPDALLAIGLRSAFAPGHPVPRLFVRDLRATGRTAFLGSTRAIDTYLAARPLPDRLETIGLRALVLFGTLDQRVDPDAATLYRKRVDTTVLPLPCAGHTPPWELPQLTAQLVAAWLGPGWPISAATSN